MSARRGGGLLLGLLLALPGAAAAEAEGALKVLGLEGSLRLYRFETEPWPLEAGAALPDNSRVELEAGARLRLRRGRTHDFCLAGPARLTVYAVPAPGGGEFDEDRVVLKLDEGALLVDGRFQFGRPADLVLGLPDRSLPLPAGTRFFAVVKAGRSSLFLPRPDRRREAQAAAPGPQGLTPAAGAWSGPGAGSIPAALYEELERPVKLFVIARDYDQDLGVWPRPPVLGPLLVERLAALKGVQVVDGSGEAQLAHQANGALKKGEDFFLREMARARGARWLLAGNCVAGTPPGESAPGERALRGQAEVRLLEAEDDGGGLELVSESAVTRVARAGRPLQQASRQALEAASDEVAGYLQWHLENLLQGRAHAQVLLRLEVEEAGDKALQALRDRLASLDSVQRVFRRSWSARRAAFDLVLRKTPADFDRQWAAAPAQGWKFVPLPAGEGKRRCRAERMPEAGSPETPRPKGKGSRRP